MSIAARHGVRAAGILFARVIGETMVGTAALFGVPPDTLHWSTAPKSN